MYLCSKYLKERILGKCICLEIFKREDTGEVYLSSKYLKERILGKCICLVNT